MCLKIEFEARKDSVYLLLNFVDFYYLRTEKNSNKIFLKLWIASFTHMINENKVILINYKNFYDSALLKVLRDTGWERENEKLWPGVYIPCIHITHLHINGKKLNRTKRNIEGLNAVLTWRREVFYLAGSRFYYWQL